jgi:hypothetical protein
MLDRPSEADGRRALRGHERMFSWHASARSGL